MKKLRDWLDVLFGRVRLDRPLICDSPRHLIRPVRRTISEFEAELLGKGLKLGCSCGGAMRRAPHPADTDLKTGAATR